jgi:hypothetical protein
VQFEAVIIGDTVYIRGQFAAMAPNATPTASGWIVVDPATVDGSSQFGAMVANLTEPAGPPYRELSEAERGRAATPLGERTIAGRVCVAYQIADTTQTGERIEVVLALGSDDLPCAIETRIGDSVSVTSFAYNLPVEIEAPTG